MTVLSVLVRWTRKLLALAYHHGWRVPKDIRGVVWTAAFWAFVIFGLVSVGVAVVGGAGAAVLVAALAYLLMRREDRKPKKLGRPLPYRRRR